LYVALDAAWLQEQEEVEARQFDGKVHGCSENMVERQMPGLYFQGQGMYGRPKDPRSRSFAPSRSSIGHTSNSAPGKNGIDRFGKPRLCNNCQSPDHFIRDCDDKPRNIFRNVAKQIKNNPEQIRQILFEMCLQAEDACFADKVEGFIAFFAEAENSEVVGPEGDDAHPNYF
jgi:Zinc knuckle